MNRWHLICSQANLIAAIFVLSEEKGSFKILTELLIFHNYYYYFQYYIMLILLLLCLLLFIFIIMNTIFIFIIITVVGTIFMRNRPERTIMSYRCRIDRSKNMCMFYQTWHIRALPCSEHMIKILFNRISESLYHISMGKVSEQLSF